MSDECKCADDGIPWHNNPECPMRKAESELAPAQCSVRCEVVVPHVRELDGQTVMFEPLISGIVTLPNDEDTQKCIERGWLKIAEAPNDQAERRRERGVE